MKQMDMIDELEKAKKLEKANETVTVKKADLETIIEALDASYKVFEPTEGNELEFIKDEFIHGDAEDQIHGGFVLMNIGTWNLGIPLLVKMQDLLNPAKKKETVKPIIPPEKKVITKDTFTNCFGEKIERQK
jgi:hypothetical protein